MDEKEGGEVPLSVDDWIYRGTADTRELLHMHATSCLEPSSASAEHRQGRKLSIFGDRVLQLALLPNARFTSNLCKLTLEELHILT